MPKKPTRRKPESEEFESFDVAPETAGEFEDVDLDEDTESTETEFTIESLGELTSSQDQFHSLAAAREEIERTYLMYPEAAMAATAADGVHGLGNVVGVGIGEKEVDGFPTGQLAVKVFVREKLNPDEVSSEALIPASIGGVQTDVDTTGEVSAQAFLARLRPAPGGVSIGNCSRVMAGTLGCLVRRGNHLFILSNNHVIALSNTSPIGTLIPQPGRLDGGVCNQDGIARLAQFAPIVFSPQVCNFVDAAIARTSPRLVDRRILRPGGVRQPLAPPTVAPALGRLVQKSGRTTQYRRGLIDAVNVTINVSYAPIAGVARFCRQFRVRGIGAPFSAAGDSGSLVTTWPQNNPTGLLFAGGGGFTFCNDIRRVLASLGVSIVF